jgi:hypothetical protein
MVRKQCLCASAVDPRFCRNVAKQAKTPGRVAQSIGVRSDSTVFCPAPLYADLRMTSCHGYARPPLVYPSYSNHVRAGCVAASKMP